MTALIEALAERPNVSEATEIQACTQTEATNDKKGEQASPGRLIKDDKSLKYSMLGWIKAKLKVKDIQHFDLIPDYHLPTSAEKPIVVISPKGFFCIEGWEFVCLANEKKVVSIYCEVEKMMEHSDEELCLRKAAIRVKTRGGDASYIESCRNSFITLELLKTTREELIFFNHGGIRHKGSMTGDKINDAKYILSTRLGKQGDTITAHLRHIEGLSGEAIQFFIEHQAEKRFFEKVQSKKRNKMRELEGEKKSPDEILELVYAFMVEEWEKYKLPQNNTNNQPTITTPESQTLADPDEVPTEGLLDEQVDEMDDSASEISVNADSAPENITERSIKKIGQEVSTRLSEKSTDNTPIDEYEACIRAELLNLTRILAMISHYKKAHAS